MSFKKNSEKCDICNELININYGILSANVSESSTYKGQKRELYLCEGCLFNLIAHLKAQKRIMYLFDENAINLNLDDLDHK